MRVLLDTSVLRAGLVSNAGASRRLLVLALNRNLTIVASTALMLEYEAVLTRRETLQAAGVFAEDVIAFLDTLCGLCLPIAVHVRWRPQSPDRGDDMIVDAAVNGLEHFPITPAHIRSR